MKALLLNTLLGLGLGRFGTIWAMTVLVPIVAAEVAYGIYAYQLSAGCAQLAFMRGALLRPLPGKH